MLGIIRVTLILSQASILIELDPHVPPDPRPPCACVQDSRLELGNG